MNKSIFKKYAKIREKLTPKSRKNTSWVTGYGLWVSCYAPSLEPYGLVKAHLKAFAKIYRIRIILQ